MDNPSTAASLSERIHALEEDSKRNREFHQRVADKMEQMRVDIAVQGQQFSNILQEIKSLSADFHNVRADVTNIGKHSLETKGLQADLDSLRIQIEEVNKRPAKRWELLIAALISSAVSLGFSLLAK